MTVEEIVQRPVPVQEPQCNDGLEPRLFLGLRWVHFNLSLRLSGEQEFNGSSARPDAKMPVVVTAGSARRSSFSSGKFSVRSKLSVSCSLARSKAMSSTKSSNWLSDISETNLRMHSFFATQLDPDKNGP